MTEKPTLSITFIPREKQRSEYDWADITIGIQRVGKARCLIEGKKIIIYSINVYPEFAGHGHGRGFVDYCKAHFDTVVADRVRPTAVGFWHTMGFRDTGDSTWVFTPPR
jgi:GNAT superfamily N-acetyltransferase